MLAAMVKAIPENRKNPFLFPLEEPSDGDKKVKWVLDSYRLSLSDLFLGSRRRIAVCILDVLNLGRQVQVTRRLCTIFYRKLPVLNFSVHFGCRLQDEQFLHHDIAFHLTFRLTMRA